MLSFLDFGDFECAEAPFGPCPYGLFTLVLTDLEPGPVCGYAAGPLAAPRVLRYPLLSERLLAGCGGFGRVEWGGSAIKLMRKCVWVWSWILSDMSW